MTAGAGRCPLCRSTDARELARLASADIFRNMERTVGVHFSEDVVARHAPAPDVSCRRCSGCGLDWFDPAVPGDAAFYEQLSAGLYYQPQRWEFEQVAARLRSTDAVVDLGCGAGAFLRRIAGSVQHAVGVDHSAVAVASLRTAGIEASSESFADFSAHNPGRFDVVTAFQTLEHVDDVTALLWPAVRCLAPAGRLFLSVPNRERYAQADPEALDWPPHHLSRWSGQQMPEVARRYGLEVVRTVTEPPDLSTASLYVQRGIERRARFVLGPAARTAARVVRKVALGRRTHGWNVARGAYLRRDVHGHTLLAEFVKT